MKQWAAALGKETRVQTAANRETDLHVHLDVDLLKSHLIEAVTMRNPILWLIATKCDSFTPAPGKDKEPHAMTSTSIRNWTLSPAFLCALGQATSLEDITFQSTFIVGGLALCLPAKWCRFDICNSSIVHYRFKRGAMFPKPSITSRSTLNSLHLVFL